MSGYECYKWNLIVPTAANNPDPPFSLDEAEQNEDSGL